ncbi:hypothetical protein, partial [Paracoccus haeundaensis]|uniref:hypothetical protein n=1 Tax=Paracoccus haeundaensis TaxID=225362 RepID=UPI001C400A8B
LLIDQVSLRSLNHAERAGSMGPDPRVEETMTGTVVAFAKAKGHRFSKNLALETLLLAGISGRSL